MNNSDYFIGKAFFLMNKGTLYDRDLLKVK